MFRSSLTEQIKPLSKKRYAAFKYIKWALLLCNLIAIGAVNLARWNDLSASATAENKRDLSSQFESLAGEVECEGFGAIPMESQELWRTMDTYACDAKTGEFITAPRFEPWSSRVKQFQENPGGTPITCWTKQFKLAVGGERSVGVFKDYREMDVIAAYGLITVKGREAVLLIEMDIDEAMSVSLKWYHWLDLILASIINFAIAAIIFIVHHRLEFTLERMEQTNNLAAQVLAKYKSHKKEIQETSDDDLGKLLDDLSGHETLSEWDLGKDNDG